MVGLETHLPSFRALLGPFPSRESDSFLPIVNRSSVVSAARDAGGDGRDKELQGIGGDRVELQALQGFWYHEGVQEHGRVCQCVHIPDANSRPPSRPTPIFSWSDSATFEDTQAVLPTPSRCRWLISLFSEGAWESRSQRRAEASPSRFPLSSRTWRCYR